MWNTYNRVYISCCKYGENRYCERWANKKLCASKHTGLLNSCFGKLCLHPYLVVPLISARVTLISTRVSAHCQAILLFSKILWSWCLLTHWGRVTHICVSELTIIGSDNGLAPGRRQSIIWNYAGLLLIEPLGTNFSEILIEIHIFSFKNIHLKMSSGKWLPFRLGINVLMNSHRFQSTRS